MQALEDVASNPVGNQSPTTLTCRFCRAPLTHTFVDLGTSPLCQRHVEPDRQREAEPLYTLHAYVCEECFLVQLDEFVAPSEIFGDGQYAYFSSYSDSWLAHAKRYVELVSERFALGSESWVVEIASNDGYLLQYFKERGVPVLGVEPASNTAEAARQRGIETLVQFFGQATAQTLRQQRGGADLILGNNVLAHVPDINDFVAGVKTLLKPDGVVTFEFPHLLQLIEQNQFDTIYHEHFSYLSCMTVQQIFAHHGLALFDVDELGTHGGSLRIYATHQESSAHAATGRVAALVKREVERGFRDFGYYDSFAERVRETKRGLLTFLIEAKRAGKSIAGYGAPGKGNTLLNYCGIRTDFVDYTVDRNPHKQGRLLPGTRIPIRAPEEVRRTKPDYLLLLPWNLREEIMQQMSFIRDWGGQFVVPIPEVTVYP